MSAPVLQLNDVTVRADSRTILDVAELAVAAGESVALLGPNGAGKTTLLHVAALLRQPDTGQVSILGQTATPERAARLRRVLSVVFQDPLLFDVDVLANASAGLRFHGVPRREAERRSCEWLQRFGVEHLSQRRARSLSGGEASRVALARAFATEPAILLLDEPFAALDAPTRASLLPELRRRLHETAAAAVLVSHDLAEAFAFGDRVAVMQNGHILAAGEAANLIAHPPSRAVAELLGVETILPARVTRRDGNQVSLFLRADGPVIEVIAPDGAACGAAQTVTFTLPAAAARVLRSGEDAPPRWNVVTGRVTSAIPLPFGTRLTVETPAPIAALAPWANAREAWSIGDGAAVAFPPDGGHVIVEAGTSNRVIPTKEGSRRIPYPSPHTAGWQPSPGDLVMSDVVTVASASEEIAPENRLNGLLAAPAAGRRVTLATAESCTGGNVAARITTVAGASDYFLGGIVSYSNEAKVSLLGVSEETLASRGAVSAECARQMAEGARRAFAADFAVSTTGIAGRRDGPQAGRPRLHRSRRAGRRADGGVPLSRRPRRRHRRGDGSGAPHAAAGCGAPPRDRIGFQTTGKQDG